ncbi:MAG: flagellar hook-length control protein FliK [Armatimonadetes bacterium]|nr:flagellar hook-length control protein FliK [Armatimonadota bacterium]
MDILQITARPVPGGDAFGGTGFGLRPQPTVAGGPPMPTDKAPPGSATATSQSQVEVASGPKNPKNLLDLLRALLAPQGDNAETASFSAKLGDAKLESSLEDVKLPLTQDSIVPLLAAFGISVPQPASTPLDGVSGAFVQAVQASDMPKTVKDLLSNLIRTAANPLPAAQLIDMRRPAPTPVPPMPQPIDVPGPGTQSPFGIKTVGTAQEVPQPIELPGTGTKAPFRIWKLGTAGSVPQPIQLPDPIGGTPAVPSPKGTAASDPQPIIVPNPTMTNVVPNPTVGGETPAPQVHINVKGEIQSAGKTFDYSIVKWLGLSQMDVQASAGTMEALVAPQPLGKPVAGSFEVAPSPVPKPPIQPSNVPMPVDASTPKLLVQGIVTDTLFNKKAVGNAPVSGVDQSGNGTEALATGTAATAVQPTPKPEKPDATAGVGNDNKVVPQPIGNNGRPSPIGPVLKPADLDELLETKDRKESNASTDSVAAASKAPVTGNVTSVPRPTVLPKQVVDSIRQQIVDRIETMANAHRNGSVKIKLNPDDLGTITLTVRNFGTKIDTSIKASHDDVRAALELNRADLVKNVESRGLSLNSFQVGQDAQSQGNASGNRADFTEAQRSANLRLSAQPAPSNGAAGNRPVPTGAVDYLA